MGDYNNKAAKNYSLDTSNNADNVYGSSAQNPNYAERFQPENIQEYKDSVYDRISELLLQNWSEITKNTPDVTFESLQKTYKKGKLVTGRDKDDLMVVYESDVDANADDSKIEGALLNWLDFVPVSYIQMRIVTTAEVVVEGKPDPPNLILSITGDDRPDFNINEIVGTMELKDINLKDNVSQFLTIKNVNTEISRAKLDENVDTTFNELSPITFTDKLDRYQKAKSEIPFFRYRVDDFFQEYNENNTVPMHYRIEKLFEEFERIKSSIPPGRLLPYNSTIPLLSEISDERLFDWETLTYLVAESQDMIGTTNPIFSQEDAQTWQSKITNLTQYGAQMSGSWDVCEKRLRAIGEGFSDATGSIDEVTITGCTDATATNFNPDATDDDGTCMYAETGIEVFAQGTGLNNNLPRILRLGDLEVYSQSAGRGLRMTVISPDSISGGQWNGNTKFDQTYDVYNGPNARNDMAEDILQGTDVWSLNDLFVITSWDAVGYNDLLVEALKSIGGCFPRLVNGIGSQNSDLNVRTPYVLVGSKAQGECGGNESVGDDASTTPPSIIQKVWNPFMEVEFLGDMGGPDPIYGCTDSSATNYDQYADTDDGSCTYATITGCTDPMAANYNPDAEEDDGSCLVIVTPTFEASMDNWKDIYSPSDYWFRSIESSDNQEWSIGQVLQTDGPEGANDTAVRIYRTRASGVWPGALYSPSWNLTSERTDATWIGAEPRKPKPVYLEENRTYTWSGWGRCGGDNSNGFANVFVGDTRGGNGDNNWDYSWKKSAQWQTNGQWEYKEFDFVPVRNKHVSQGKWKIDFMVELDSDGNWKNIGHSPSLWQPSYEPSPNTNYIVKTEYWTTIDKDWNGGTMVNFLYDFGSNATGQMFPGSNNILVRATGKFNITTAGYKKFSVIHDDGARLYVDGELLIDKWSGGGDRWNYSEEIYLDEGLHDLEVRVYENEGYAAMRGVRMWEGEMGTSTNALVQSSPLLEHADESLITEDDISGQAVLYPGVMMNMYLYPGTTSGSGPGDYCDYANIKVTPKIMAGGGKFNRGGPIPSSYNPGPTNEVNRDIRIPNRGVQRTRPLPSRRTPIKSSYNPGPTNEVNRDIIIPARDFSFKSQQKYNETMGRPVVNNNRCQEERQMLERAMTLPLDKMVTEIQTWLRTNKPCLSVKKQFDLGGQTGHNSMDHPSNICCHTSCGDINGDGQVNVVDVVRMVDIILGQQQFSAEEFACGDMGQDGTINVLDVIQMVDVILGNSSGGNCNLCAPPMCTGIIGCDGVCYTEHNGTAINGPNDENFLPTSARFDACGVCGGGIFDCDDCCQANYDYMNSINNCETDMGMGTNNCCTNQQACRTTGEVVMNDSGEYQVTLGSWDGLCSWEMPFGPCHHQQSGERGGVMVRTGVRAKGRKKPNNPTFFCNSNMSYNECRQFLINNIPDSDVSTFTTWYDAMGENGYRQILNNQVSRLEDIPSIQRLLPSENIRGQNYMPDNPNLIFCMGCGGVYGFGSCSGTCCGLSSSSIEPIVDPYTNEEMAPGGSSLNIGCRASTYKKGGRVRRKQ